ncbi:RAD51-associated protein 1 isoform X1 [Fukomys damarensis]|uniref:RAD51-associated protein 1 isoform X1 n=1 Tax=Fukomys damarensis TaxID=885580 RepID=UPI00053FB295|nr:RAD51-associated protein 1 isoform X1 [Fukomys damarensis]XP_010609894.1 RAD51-associated protein 1 isoform X1 [Fukomys damarensis]XP_010609895.1 RAD51-associated protein 1 isoform X1 [Fukomys damarensis]XP_010609896.1 RAD51-associated protein 1 isoform X1 [Fukomys damarensis]XP_010609897.1 RAD51-associated protein 1 isoform X1 [Fukomys damarensis]
MVRPVRNKKPVNYSQFENSDSDDDFISATIPLSKKPRIAPKELKEDKPKPNLKNVQKEDMLLQEKTPNKRMVLDDKIFQRGLEAALALSVKDHPVVANDVQKSQDKSIEKPGNGKTEIMNKSLHISNCSIAADYLDLDRISEEGNAQHVQGKGEASSKAQQRRTGSEGSDGHSADDTEPDDASGEGSENNSDFDESEDNEEDFTMRKSKVKENKRKEVKVKSPVEKKEKKSKSKCNALVTAGDSSPAAIKSKSQSSPKEVSSSEATWSPLQIRSPSAESRRPKWVPPAASGSSSGDSSLLGGMATKSPSQSLRLGLSRLARVKPLHPNATSSHVW